MESKRNETKKEDKSDNSFNLGKTTQIEVYDFRGNKLNLSICDDIKILKYIGDAGEELNLKSAESLSNQGIDVFNPKDSFFNDLCHKFDNEEGKDIILTDRRNDLFQNATFCEDGCSYSGIDYVLKTAICICNSNTLQGEQNITNDNKEQSEDLNFKTLTKSFIENLLDFNIDVIFCYNLVFDLKRLVKNIGFYFMIIMLLIQIIFLIIYSIKKLKPIEYFMFIFSIHKNKDSPPKNNNTNTNNKNIKSKEKEKINKYPTGYNSSHNKEINESYNDNSRRKFKMKNEKDISEEQNNITNLDNILKNETNPKNKTKNNKTNLLNSQSNSVYKLITKDNNKLKKNKKSKFFLNNNFAPTTNIKSPIFNISSAEKNSSSFQNINNIISTNQKGSKNSKLEIQDLPTSIKRINVILDKMKKKKNKKKSKKNKALSNMETINEKEDNIKNEKRNNINKFIQNI